jgi:hypothetical protein
VKLKTQALLREFCSKCQFDNRVPVSEENRREAGAVAAGHRPATPYADKIGTKEERRDSCSATEEEGWRACYGQIEAQIIEQLAKELEMPRGAFSYVD